MPRQLEPKEGGKKNSYKHCFDNWYAERLSLKPNPSMCVQFKEVLFTNVDLTEKRGTQSFQFHSVLRL